MSEGVKDLSDLIKRWINERKSQPIHVRVPSIIYMLYQSFSKDDIQELKQVISAFVISKAIEKGVSIPEDLKKQYMGVFTKNKEGNNVVFNINISKNENAVNNNINIDVSTLVSKLNELEQLLLQIQTHNWDKDKHAYLLPLARMKELSEKLKDLKKFFTVN